MTPKRRANLERLLKPRHVAVIGGRDLREGGTWMGLSPTGRVAWLTNVRRADVERGERQKKPAEYRSRNAFPTRRDQPCGDAEHVLLGDPHLEVAVRVGLLEGVLVELHGIGLQRRVDQKGRLLGPGIAARHKADRSEK